MTNNDELKANLSDDTGAMDWAYFLLERKIKNLSLLNSHS